MGGATSNAGTLRFSASLLETSSRAVSREDAKVRKDAKVLVIRRGCTRRSQATNLKGTTSEFAVCARGRTARANRFSCAKTGADFDGLCYCFCKSRADLGAQR